MQFVSLHTAFVNAMQAGDGRHVTKEQFTLTLVGWGDGIESPPFVYTIQSLDPSAAFGLGLKMGQFIDVTFDNRQGGTPPSNLLLNGTFADSSAWILGAGWAISAGAANFTGAAKSSLYQAVALAPGVNYQLEGTIPAPLTNVTFSCYFMSDATHTVGNPFLTLGQNFSGDFAGNGVAPAGVAGIGIQANPKAGVVSGSVDAMSLTLVG
jgi:hypothetical protein